MAKPTIVTRATKGSALTWTEGDANITNLRDATITLTAGSGGTSVTSDLNGIVTLVAGTNVTLSGDNTAKTVTINASGSSGLANVVEDTTPQLGGALDVNGFAITSASNGNISITPNGTGIVSVSSDLNVAGSIIGAANSPVVIAPDGTGDVHLNTDSVRIGDNNSDATIATRGTGDLILTTNEGSGVEGIIRIYDGANGNITVTPNGTGNIVLDGQNWPQADGTANYILKTNGSGQLSWTANALTASKATNLVGGNGTTLLGSIPYQSATDTTSLLSPNTTVTSKFLTQVGDGTNGMAPMWSTISSLDNVTIGSVTPAAASFTTTTVRTGNELRLNNTANTYYAGFKAGTMASNVVWTLPSTDGTNGQALKTDGAGGLTFGSISANPAGSDTQVQYNNAGSFGANSALTFNIATGALSATSFIGALTGTASKATNLVGGNGTTLLGSIPYQSAADTTTLLSPNTTTTNKFLAQVGDGTNGMAPMWQAITSLENVTIGSATANTGNFTTLTVKAANELRLADTDSSHYVGFKAPATVATNKVWTLPSTDGTSGQVLSTNGSATLSWATAGGGNNIITLSASGSSISFPNTGEGNSTTNWTLESAGGVSGVSVSTVFFTLPAGTYNLQMPMARSSSTNNYGDMRLWNNTAGVGITNISNMQEITISGSARGVMFPNNILFTLASSAQLVFKTIDAIGSTWTLNAQTGRYVINIYKTA
jgi:hypothetical protein